ncbi:MAG: phosphate acyltransferase PlsX [Clostridia bacterium]|nr:phosphate acyltransferase PlsX [Clostridia bacterium]
MRIAIDAMGGDNAPQAAAEGALLAVSEYGCEITLVGDEERIKPLLEGKDNAEKITLVHASETIENDEKATAAVRGKKDSSMSVALTLLAEGKADAAVSAGSTGALLSGATFIVKRIKGVRRAAIATVMPNLSGGKTMLLDSGANSECTPEFLLQFALLGSLYMEKICGVSSPRVALLNNGTEEKKGAPLQKESFELLKSAGARNMINFIGNKEGRDIFAGDADVLVCDGFSGNIALKTIEGTAAFIMKELKAAFMKNPMTKISALAAKKSLSSLKNTLDYNKVGGAPFLGISKPVIKAHGSSDAEAFCAAVGQAIVFSESGYIRAVSENIDSIAEKKE